MFDHSPVRRYAPLSRDVESQDFLFSEIFHLTIVEIIANGSKRSKVGDSSPKVEQRYELMAASAAGRAFDIK